jgi:uncharacterized membrane protein HdeD (DUF308 family)
MSPNRIAESLVAGVHEMRSSWGWFLALGILLILLGVVCIIGDVTATFVTVIAFGWLLMISGVVSLIQAFRVPTWSGFLLHLLSAVLRGFTGYVLVRYPGAGAVAVTLIIASFFVVGGTFRAVGAAMMRFPQWGWAVFSGVVAVLLGIMLLAQMPTSSLWFIGFAIGIDMILEGASLVGFAMAVHRLPEAPQMPTYKAA